MTEQARSTSGKFRSAAEQEASRLLFGDSAYVPKHPQNEFMLDGEWIPYDELVAKIRKDARK